MSFNFNAVDVVESTGPIIISLLPAVIEKRLAEFFRKPDIRKYVKCYLDSSGRIVIDEQIISKFKTQLLWALGYSCHDILLNNDITIAYFPNHQYGGISVPVPVETDPQYVDDTITVFETLYTQRIVHYSDNTPVKCQYVEFSIDFDYTAEYQSFMFYFKRLQREMENKSHLYNVAKYAIIKNLPHVQMHEVDNFAAVVNKMATLYDVKLTRT